MPGGKHLQLDESLSHVGEVQGLSESAAGIP